MPARYGRLGAQQRSGETLSALTLMGARLRLHHRPKKLQRSVRRSVPALERDIRTWIKDWNDDPRPYVWNTTADQILGSLARYFRRINDSGH